MRTAITAGKVYPLVERFIEFMLTSLAQRFGGISAVHQPFPPYHCDLPGLARAVCDAYRNMVLFGKHAQEHKGTRKSLASHALRLGVLRLALGLALSIWSAFWLLLLDPVSMLTRLLRHLLLEVLDAFLRLAQLRLKPIKALLLLIQPINQQTEGTRGNALDCRASLQRLQRSIIHLGQTLDLLLRQETYPGIGSRCLRAYPFACKPLVQGLRIDTQKRAALCQRIDTHVSILFSSSCIQGKAGRKGVLPASSRSSHDQRNTSMKRTALPERSWNFQSIPGIPEKSGDFHRATREMAETRREVPWRV